MPYRLAIPQYERQGMSETYLSSKGVKSMRKQLNDKTRLAESNRCCVAMTPSAVERIGAVVRAVRRIPLSAAYTVNQKWRTDYNRSSPVFRLRVYYTLQK